MKRSLVFCSLFALKLFSAPPQPEASKDWNLAQVYESATIVFYGEVSKNLPATDFNPGTSGVYIHDIDSEELPFERTIWPKARELSFTVTERLKGKPAEIYIAYIQDPNTKIWTYIQHENGDTFLAKPEPPKEALINIAPGEPGLFFIRNFWGTQIPVVYKARLGQLASDDLALLRRYKSNTKQSLQTVIQEAQAKKQAIAESEAIEFRALEDDYYKILRIQDLEIRRSLLNDLIERMGFQGAWTYFEFKERYLKKYGAYVAENELSSIQLEGKEKLWHDISGEITKIDYILKARSKSP